MGMSEHFARLKDKAANRQAGAVYSAETTTSMRRAAMAARLGHSLRSGGMALEMAEDGETVLHRLYYVTARAGAPSASVNKSRWMEKMQQLCDGVVVGFFDGCDLKALHLIAMDDFKAKAATHTGAIVSIGRRWVDLVGVRIDDHRQQGEPEKQG